MNDDHLVSLVEELGSKLDRVVEAVSQIQDQTKDLPTVKDDIEQLKSDIQAMKTTVAEQAQRLSPLEQSQ